MRIVVMTTIVDKVKCTVLALWVWEQDSLRIGGMSQKKWWLTLESQKGRVNYKWSPKNCVHKATYVGSNH